MSTEQERVDAHHAAVMAWARRIPAVLASPDTARGLALAIVSELLCVFGRGPLAEPLLEVATLHGEVIAVSVGGIDLGDIRARADLLGSRLFLRSSPTWRWDARIPYEVCEALRRACEDDAVLCGKPSKIRCTSCILGVVHTSALPAKCITCTGRGWLPSEPIVPPILALLLHDAAALLVDLRADLGGFESLVREAERRERARTKGAEER